MDARVTTPAFRNRGGNPDGSAWMELHGEVFFDPPYDDVPPIGGSMTRPYRIVLVGRKNPNTYGSPQTYVAYEEYVVADPAAEPQVNRVFRADNLEVDTNYEWYIHVYDSSTNQNAGAPTSGYLLKGSLNYNLRTRSTINGTGNPAPDSGATADTRSLYFSRNPIPVDFATANQGEPNFRFELVVTPTGEAPITLTGKPGTDGTYSFDISSLLHGYLSPGLPVTEQRGRKVTQTIESFRLDKKTIYGENPSVRDQSTETHAVLMGGLAFADWPGHTELDSSRWLTWQPTEKKVLPEAPEFLYFLHVGEETQYKIHFRVHYTDATQDGYYENFGTPLNNYEIQNFGVGYEQAGIGDLHPGKRVSYYEVFVSSSTNPASDADKSEVRRYVVDHQYYEHVRHFLYLNSLSGLDTLTCTGVFTDESEVTRQAGEYIVTGAYQATDATIFTRQTGEQYGYQGNSGPLSVAHKRHLRELLLSDYVYEYLPNGVYAPIVLDTKKASWVTDRQNRHSLSFRYTMAYLNRAYSML